MQWIYLVLGIWLILAPFVLGYSDTAGALWSDIIVGVLIVIGGLWGLSKNRKPMMK